MGASPPLHSFAPAGATNADADAGVQAALRLLRLEADIRRQGKAPELAAHLVNQVPSLLPMGQILLLERTRPDADFHVQAAGGVTDIDRGAPLIQAIEAALASCQGSERMQEGKAMALPALAPWLPPDMPAPFAHMLWVPLTSADHEGPVMMGALFCRDTPFTPGEDVLLGRLRDTYAHAWRALAAPRAWQGHAKPIWRRKRWAALALIGVSLLPVHSRVMAPVEVVPVDPFIVTAPFAGVVRQLLVEAGTQVEAGAEVLRFEDIQPRNELELSQQRMAVAQARSAKASASAFQDASAARDMAILQAEDELARLGFEYAREVMQRTLVSTPVAGVVLYTDRRDWEGRPVQVGEEIMQIANPGRVAYRIDLPADNLSAVAPGAHVKVLLDNAPLGGIPATLSRVNYTPRADASGAMSYTLVALPADGSAPRLGTRGTAQLQGERVPLIMQLLRRPIAALRQFIGL